MAGARRKSRWAAKGNKEAIGLRHGFRSGLEETNAKKQEAMGFKVCFEEVKIKYFGPAI